MRRVREWGSSTRASVVDLTFAIWAILVPLLYHHEILNGDGDLIRHIVIGRHILEAGPRFADPFSFSRPGEPFLAYEWLSQVIFASTHDLLGLGGIVMLATLLIAGSCALVVAYVRRGGGDPWLAFLTGAAVAVMTYPHWVARPHLFTFLGTAALLHLLEPRKRVLWLVPLFAVWSNLHPGFLYGLVMIALWSTGHAIEDLRRGQRPLAILRRRSAPFLLASGASLLNPFGYTLHTHALAWVGNDTVRSVAEFTPLAVHTPNGLFFLAVVGAIVVGLAAHREWVGWPALLVLGASVVAALDVSRNTPMFALFALPLCARALTPVVRSLPAWAFGGMRAEFARSDTRGWRVGATATALVAALLVADARIERIAVIPDRFSADVFPAAAIAHAQSDGLDGRLLSYWTWGGYILFSWPEQRLFVDSMADFFGADLVREYMKLHHARPGWRESLASLDVSLVLFPPDVPLVDALRGAPDWRVAYEDHVAVLFRRSDVDQRFATDPTSFLTDAGARADGS